MGSSNFQSHISAHRGTVAAASSSEQAPVILGVLRAVVMSLSFWVGVGYVVLLLA